MSTKKYWRITGYDSLEKIYEEFVPLRTFSEKQMSLLLQALAARAGLSFSEIVDSYARRNAERYRPLLEVRIDSHPKFCITCGDNPHFSALVVEK